MSNKATIQNPLENCSKTRPTQHYPDEVPGFCEDRGKSNFPRSQRVILTLSLCSVPLAQVLDVCHKPRVEITGIAERL